MLGAGESERPVGGNPSTPIPVRTVPNIDSRWKFMAIYPRQATDRAIVQIMLGTLAVVSVSVWSSDKSKILQHKLGFLAICCYAVGLQLGAQKECGL